MFPGPELPVSLSRHSMVTLDLGQAIIGGVSNGIYQRKIYHIKCSNVQLLSVQDNCDILTLETELLIARSAFVAIPIPDFLSGCSTEGKTLQLWNFIVIEVHPVQEEPCIGIKIPLYS